MTDIVSQLRQAANGHPYAKIKWPHRVLIDAAHEIEQLRMAVRALQPFAEYQLSEMTKERNTAPVLHALKIAKIAMVNADD